MIAQIQDVEGSEKPIKEVDAVVVGAGFAGIYMLHKLRETGLSVQVIEAGEGIGGTWFWNRYPGARVDVRGMDYSYSFDSDLEQEWDWTEKYPTQEDILHYINHVADRFDLRKDVRLKTRVTDAVYNEILSRWIVGTDSGETFSAQYVVMATGCLSVPNYPKISGIDSFGGRIHHTGLWSNEEVDFTDRKVAVIGTGSSGVHVIPVIAEGAAELTVFQRTPSFVFPAHNHSLDSNFKKETKDRYPAIRTANRESSFGVAVPSPTQSALEVSEEHRNKFYSDVWNSENSLLTSMFDSFTDILTNIESNETAADFVRDRIGEIVKDPNVAELLKPTGFPFGTKRPSLGTNYYETFNLPHVNLLDVNSTPIVEITENGVRTSESLHDFDDIVFATGFDAMTGALNSINIRGRENNSLRDKWAEGPLTYLGISMSGFPNLFTITGPGSPSVLSNMMVSIEQHVEWVGTAISWMRENSVNSLEATAEAEEEWTKHVEEVGSMTLYSETDSWYTGANISGKPRVMMPYIGGVGNYRKKCEQVAAEGYEGFISSR